jgi:hypothetical protein
MMHHIAPEEVLAVIDQAAGPHPMYTSVMEDPRAAASELPTGGDQYGRLKE